MRLSDCCSPKLSIDGTLNLPDCATCWVVVIRRIAFVSGSKLRPLSGGCLAKMVKRKRRQQLVVPLEKNGVSSTLIGEDDWVIVKKQRITILIPPLHAIATNAHNIPTKSNNQLPPPTQFLKQERPKELDQTPGIIPNMRDESLTLQDTRTPLRRPGRLLIGPNTSVDGGVFLNQMMRASNLDSKIRRAGGLSNWLASLGLHQFARLFNRRRVDKFQLVNLTMKKLKDMGATAVGPRRKLMHAIDCLCQPYCFESLHVGDVQP